MVQKKLYIETYGCQMNVADSEVVAAILQEKNYQLVQSAEDADAPSGHRHHRHGDGQP